MITLDAKAQARLNELAQRYGLKLLALFGSQVTGQTHRASDVDAAYLSAKPLDLMAEARLITDLMPVLKSPELDLVDLRRAGPFLRYNIFRAYRPLYRQAGFSVARLEIAAFKQYLELSPLFAARDAYLTRRLGLTQS